jgi:glycosyltransferase involved in cell wall biosynthesis
LKNIGVLAFSNKDTGGVLQYTQSLIDALNKDNNKNYKLVIFVFEIGVFNCGQAEVRIVKKRVTKLSKKVAIFTHCLFNFKKTMGLSDGEIKAFHDIDLFFNPTISLYPNFFLDTPFVFTLHDFQERYYPSFFSKIDRVKRWLVKRTLATSAKHIVCESNYVKKDVLFFLKVDEAKVSVIPSPPTSLISNFYFDKAVALKIKKKYTLSDEYIFYPAQFWKHKNHINLIHAFSELVKDNPKLMLVLTGGKGNNYHRVSGLINLLNIGDNILYLGYISQKDLPYIYKMSNLLVMPSLFESISIPMYEAFSIGVPVCSSNVTALPEQSDGAALLFNPNNIQDIKCKIQKVINSPTLQGELINKGKEVIYNLNGTNYADSVIKVVLNLLNRRL